MVGIQGEGGGGGGGGGGGIVIMMDDHPYSLLWWMTTLILPKYNPLTIEAYDPSYTILSLYIQDCKPIKWRT